MPRYAKIVPDRSGDRILDYGIPPALEAAAGPGARVRIPLRTRVILGTVVEVSETTEASGVRDILEVVGSEPLIRPKLLELAAWISEYYCAPLEAAVACVLPQVVRMAQSGALRRNFARLARPVTTEEIEALERKAPRQADALRAVRDAGEARPVSELAETAGVAEGVFRALEKRGLLVIEAREISRDPFGGEHFLETNDLALNPGQKAACGRIRQAIAQPDPTRPILLHGVTGSGKTEIYLQAIRHALELGKTALVLVPEISLTPQTVERFKARFASIQREVAVLHSHLSAGERYDEWRKIHGGGARVVIGARSAVFAPLENLGILIVDEEHETSYKQEETPRYHARDVAVLRAAREPCAVVLGSATPSLESWHNARTAKYELLTMSQRVDDRRMPIMKVIDMRRTRADSILSPQLQMAIEGRLARGEQSILFLNRRGFSTSLVCQKCGHVCECPNCSVALTYHRDVERLTCHICGHQERAPKNCPSCHDPAIRHAGVGTQKVEQTVSRVFPKARLARMDADSMSRKDAYRETLGAFRSGKIDILVGTQMIAKGLDFPNVTLVGIINADLGLHVPDFRAGERTFQLLTQVAGRAGRGEIEGEVVVQTFTPFSPSIQFARHHDYPGFMEQELEFRERFGFPPFCRMVLLTVRARMRELAELTARTLVRRLAEVVPKGTILGEAAPAPLEKAHGSFRFQVALRGPSARAMGRGVAQVLEKLPLPEGVVIVADVDPVSLL